MKNEEKEKTKLKKKTFESIMKYSNITSNYELTKKIDLNNLELVEYFKDKLDWEYIAESKRNLSNEFIETFKDYLFGNLGGYRNGSVIVSKNAPLEVIRANKDYINWGNYIWNLGLNRFTPDFVKEFYDYLKPYFSQLSKFQLPVETFEAFKDEFTYKSIYCAEKNFKKYLPYIKDWKHFSHADVLYKKDNWKKVIDKLDFHEFTTMYNTGTKSLLLKLSVVCTEDFLLTYKDKNLNWMSIINTVNENTYLYKEITLSKDFFKDHYDELPEEAQNCYNESKQKRYEENKSCYWN